MKKLLIIALLIVGCEGVYTPKDDVHLIIGEWTGLEREQKLINSDGITLSKDISPYNKVWTFNLDNTFSEGDTTSSNSDSFSVKWSINENELTITAVIGEEYIILLYNYTINNNILSLIRIIPYENGDSLIIKLIFNKSN